MREKLFALAVSWEDVPSAVPTPESAAPHVSVFAATTREWRTLGDVVAEDLVNGNALDLSFLASGGVTLEGRLGVMMTDGSVDYGDEEDFLSTVLLTAKPCLFAGSESCGYDR